MFILLQSTHCLGHLSSTKKSNIFCTVVSYITDSIFGKCFDSVYKFYSETTKTVNTDLPVTITLL